MSIGPEAAAGFSGDVRAPEETGRRSNSRVATDGAGHRVGPMA